MEDLLKLIEDLNGLKEESKAIKYQAKRKKEELERIKYKKQNEIADKNIARFKTLLNKADIDSFKTSILIRYNSSYGTDDYNVIFSRTGCYGFKKENLFHVKLGGHSEYTPLFSLDGQVNSTYPIGEDAKFYIFVDNYDKLERDLIDSLRASIDSILAEGEKETMESDKIAEEIKDLNTKR